MRGLVFPAAIAAVLAVSPLAIAAESATGVVKVFDGKAHTLTLQDGNSYSLPMVFKDPGLKAGTRVSITWAMKDGKRHADAVTIQK